MVQSSSDRSQKPAAVERFHSFREVHSLEWHAHRHTVGQAFLDQFVRQVGFSSKRKDQFRYLT